jgi:hypothetical protein
MRNPLSVFNIKGVCGSSDSGSWTKIVAPTPRAAAELVAHSLARHQNAGAWHLVVFHADRPLPEISPDVVGRYETTIDGPAIGPLRTLAVA